MMKAVLLVGGKGTRLRPLTSNTVKAMVPILNRPFLEHLFAYLKKYRLTESILTLGYLPDQIKNYFGDGSDFGLKLSYVVEESPLGTAGAVKNVEKLVNDQTFLVFNGDIFTEIDLHQMLNFHHQRKAKVTIALIPVEDPSIYGVVEMDEIRRVKRFIEKPPRQEAPTNLINAGIYIIEPEILAEIPGQTRFMFEHHVFPKLLEEGVPIYGFPSDAYWIDIGSPDKYWQVQIDLLLGKALPIIYSDERGKCLIHPTAQIGDGVLIGQHCQIGEGVKIIGPAVIGSNCQIQEGAEIEQAILWNGVRVGPRAVLKKCLIADECFIGRGSYLPKGVVLGDRVIVADGVSLESGAKLWSGENRAVTS
jgi:mannose-1-phosphate guanylyltransferase